MGDARVQLPHHGGQNDQPLCEAVGLVAHLCQRHSAYGAALIPEMKTRDTREPRPGCVCRNGLLHTGVHTGLTDQLLAPEYARLVVGGAVPSNVKSGNQGECALKADETGLASPLPAFGDSPGRRTAIHARRRGRRHRAIAGRPFVDAAQPGLKAGPSETTAAQAKLPDGGTKKKQRTT